MVKSGTSYLLFSINLLAELFYSQQAKSSCREWGGATFQSSALTTSPPDHHLFKARSNWSVIKQIWSRLKLSSWYNSHCLKPMSIDDILTIAHVIIMCPLLTWHHMTFGKNLWTVLQVFQRDSHTGEFEGGALKLSLLVAIQSVGKCSLTFEMARNFELDSLRQTATCGICLQLYVDARVLSCHHSFCAACLVDYQTSLGDTRCPTCRQETVPQETQQLQQLPKNRLINNLVTFLSEQGEVFIIKSSLGVVDEDIEWHTSCRWRTSCRETESEYTAAIASSTSDTKENLLRSVSGDFFQNVHINSHSWILWGTVGKYDGANRCQINALNCCTCIWSSMLSATSYRPLDSYNAGFTRRHRPPQQHSPSIQATEETADNTSQAGEPRIVACAHCDQERGETDAWYKCG